MNSRFLTLKLSQLPRKPSDPKLTRSLFPASCLYLPKVTGADHDLTPAFQVVVNGDPFYEFGHRIPVQLVTHLQVDGDLTLQSINFIGGQPAPSPVRGYLFI